MNITINETTINALNQFNDLKSMSDNSHIIYYSIFDRLIFAIIICLIIKYGLKGLKQEYPIIQIKINEMKIWLIGRLKNKKNI